MMTTYNNTTAAIVNNILNERNKDIEKHLNDTLNIVNDILAKANKDIADILQQTSPAPTKNWWDGLDIQTYRQSSHTIVGWQISVNGNITYYPLFDVDIDTMSTDIFGGVDSDAVEYYKLFGGISLDDEIDLGTKVISIKAICLDEFRDKYDFKDKIFYNGVEEFQKFIKDKSLEKALKEIIEREYKYTKFLSLIDNMK